MSDFDTYGSILEEFLGYINKTDPFNPIKSRPAKRPDLLSKRFGSGYCFCHIYYFPYNKRNNEWVGFDFIALSLMDENPKDDDEAYVICRGCASYDGIRHTWWGEKDNKGYIHYPNFHIISRMCRELLVIEQELNCETSSEEIT